MRWCGKHEHVFWCIMGSSLLSVAEQLLKDLQRTYSETNQIPDDLLIALRFVFGQCALQALDLVDQRSVTCVSSPSGRKAFQTSYNR
ncbi:zinc finger SWIM domain-containing protein 7-like isoform X1 [Sinocyclocheilus grahami]|uniref:zinc finger SWIM domain-containing protein 7-like isoform X1 n=1 Tax=Sinocyclocheilus grahami TaxID=75366 RepID=UPI0007AD2974|nr:PREDICTED: zinc finger SWIM domain-containing protein 7-like isoform X1 [Sinocyclocheilus grahami]